MEENVVKKGKINETVEELLIGILFSGAVFQAAFVWLAKDKVSYSIGLWIGVLTAAFLAWHIWKSLDAALVQEEGAAQKLMRTKALLRYGLVIGVYQGSESPCCVSWHYDFEGRRVFTTAYT